MKENKETALEAKPAKKKIADKRRKKKLTIEERRAINAAKPARNKYVEAARKFQGSIIINTWLVSRSIGGRDLNLLFSDQ